MPYDHPKPWLHRPWTKCANPDCDWTVIGQSEFRTMAPDLRRAKRVREHKANGLCSACHNRVQRRGTVDRAPTSRPKDPKPPEPCARCKRLIAARPDVANGIYKHGSRGLCEPCERAARADDTLLDYPRRIRSREEVVEEWDFLRSQGVFDVRQAAARMGMTFKALDKALYLARKAGDERATLPHPNQRSAS